MTEGIIIRFEYAVQEKDPSLLVAIPSARRIIGEARGGRIEVFAIDPERPTRAWGPPQMTADNLADLPLYDFVPPRELLETMAVARNRRQDGLDPLPWPRGPREGQDWEEWFGDVLSRALARLSVGPDDDVSDGE